MTNLRLLSVAALVVLAGCTQRLDRVSSAGATFGSSCCDGTNGFVHANRVDGSGQNPVVTPWLEPAKRTHRLPARIRVTTANQESCTLGDLTGRPMALAFLYTRCTNPNRCERVAREMAALQQEATKAGLADRVRLLLCTYEPAHDRPAVLKQFGESHGLGPETLLLQPHVADLASLLDALQVAVNFNIEGVNIHGLQLFLFDAKGRWVRTHHTLIWKPAEVLRDLQALAAEASR